MVKKLKIKISLNGKVELYTEGIMGKKCLFYLPLLERLADINIQKIEKTKEYYDRMFFLRKSGILIQISCCF